MRFLNQIWLLLWKMYLQKKRSLFQTICEILLPVLLTMSVILMRYQIDKETIDFDYGLSNPLASIYNIDDNIPTLLTSALVKQRICGWKKSTRIRKYIGITPNNTQTKWFINKLFEYYVETSNKSINDYYPEEYWLESPDNLADLSRLGSMLGYNTTAIKTYNGSNNVEEEGNNGTVTLQVDQDEANTFQQSLNETTVAEWLGDDDDSSSNSSSNSTVYNEYNVTKNDSALTLLNAISEDLYNESFSDIISVGGNRRRRRQLLPSTTPMNSSNKTVSISFDLVKLVNVLSFSNTSDDNVTYDEAWDVLNTGPFADIFGDAFNASASESLLSQYINTKEFSILYKNISDEYGLDEKPKQPKCINVNSTATFLDIFKYFDSESAMGNYIKNKHYGSKSHPELANGIVFHSLSNTSIDYKLKFTTNNVPSTESPFTNLYNLSPDALLAKYIGLYLTSGFMAWQLAIDQTFLRILDYDFIYDKRVGFHIFPFDEYMQDTFWTYVKQLLPIILMLSFSYPFVVIAKSVVDEKAQRIKEHYRVLGGSNTAYLLSFIIAYFVIFSICGLLLSMVLVFNIFTRSSFSLIFVGIELFGVCMISFAMVIGMIFDEPRLTSLVAVMAFLCLFFIYRFVEYSDDESTKNAICWSGPAAFAMALSHIASQESYQIGVNWDNFDDYNADETFKLSTAYYYMFVDCILYLCLMFYLDKVFPTKYGCRRPWYSPFSCLDSLYDRIACIRFKRGRDDIKRYLSKSIESQKGVKAEFADASILGDPVLEIMNLTKVFAGGNEKTKNVAVKKLCVSMFKNQVFCLLGHNGAGKSTTCNMLTGMLPISSGDAFVTHGDQELSVKENLHEVRKLIGLCPQHDILFPNLTVWEHLQFYGQLKGMKKGNELDQVCMELLEDIYMTDKIHFRSSMLSGGQQRKLSVCIAIIGHSSLVILDEPTTGMDPFARRATWEFVRKYKKNRCIILTTHYMDEAEVLSDRIGIMADGKLMCCGSSFYLKQQYNVGYALNVSMSSSLKYHIEEVRRVIREKLRDDDVQLIDRNAKELLFRVSFSCNEYLPELFRFFDANKEELQVLKYSISATTLEEVFRSINGIGGGHDDDNAEKQRQIRMTMSRMSQSNKNKTAPFGQQITYTVEQTPYTGAALPPTLEEQHTLDLSKKQSLPPQVPASVNADSRYNSPNITSTVAPNMTSVVPEMLAGQSILLGNYNSPNIIAVKSASIDAEAVAEFVDNDEAQSDAGSSSDGMAGITVGISVTDVMSGVDQGKMKRLVDLGGQIELTDNADFVGGNTPGNNTSSPIVSANTVELKPEGKLKPINKMNTTNSMIETSVTHDYDSMFERMTSTPMGVPITRPISLMHGYEKTAEQEAFKESYADKIHTRSKCPCFNLFFWGHILLQIWKRMLNARRDSKTFWCQCAVPSACIIVGLATFALVWWENPNAYYFDTDDLVSNSHSGFPIPYTKYNDTTRKSYYQEDTFMSVLSQNEKQTSNEYIPYMTTPYQSDIKLPEWQDILYDTRSDNGTNYRYLSLFMSQFLDPNVIVVGMNASGFHSGPIGLNFISNLLAKTVDENAYIRTASHAFPGEATAQDSIPGVSKAINAFFSSIVLTIGMIFVPAAYIALLVDERIQMVKHQQLVSGMDVLSYWIGNYVFDFLCNLLPSTLCIIYVYMFQIKEFMGEGAIATWVVLILFGFSIIPFTYLFSMFFKSAGTAQSLVVFFYFATSVILMCVSWVLEQAGGVGAETNESLSNVYRLFPPFCLSSSLQGIVTRNLDYVNDGRTLSVWDWEITGLNMWIMLCEGFVYFFLLLCLEYFSKSAACFSCLNKTNEKSVSQNDNNDSDVDSDVKFQRVKMQTKQKRRRTVAHEAPANLGVFQRYASLKVANDGDDSKSTMQDPIELHGLRKVYRGNMHRAPLVAVKDLWYSVKKGEVFGFLGLNGAGKTTTLSMLSGVFLPSGGSAYINGYPISDQIAVRMSLGYCPQFSALFPRLTVEEHLHFFARIKGIGNKNGKRDNLVNQLIIDLALEGYGDRCAGKLSGGNQRKLSIGIALIGNPPVVILDEPTAGMDPISRRSLWDFIQSTMNGRSVILTTHSMEECEALCDRIGIMIKGELACIGEKNHLKQRFGGGYQVDIKFDAILGQNDGRNYGDQNGDDEVKRAITEMDDGNNVDAIELEPMYRGKSAYDYVSMTTPKLEGVFGGSEHVILLENYSNTARYRVGTDQISAADVFERMQSIKFECGIADYAVSGTTLEQIFIKFANEQREKEIKNGPSVDDRKRCEKFMACAAGVCVVD